MFQQLEMLSISIYLHKRMKCYVGKNICYIMIAFPCLPCSILAASKEGRCGITSRKAMENREGQGFLLTKVFIYSIDVMINKVLACTKGNPNVCILTEVDELRNKE